MFPEKTTDKEKEITREQSYGSKYSLFSLG